MSLAPELLRILVCPKSKALLVCRESKLVYPVQDGIPVMLIEEAKPLDEAVYPPAPLTP
jgi:uncharacterized protein YbaR (Trm112 family)